jgi:hypothetical protein
VTLGLAISRWAYGSPSRDLVRVLWALAVLGLTLLSSRSARADELSARVDATVVEVGQTISLRLEGSTTSGDVGNVEPGPTPGFRIIGRSVMPTRMVSIVNGVRTDKTGLSATFTLLAERTGATTLGPCTVTFGGRQVRSGRIDVRVVPRGQGPKQAAPQDPFGGLFGPSGAHTNPFDFLNEPSAEPEPSVDPKLALPKARGRLGFLHATVDKTRAVVGEQVTHTVYLYVEASTREPQIGDVHEAPAAAFLKKSLLESDNEARHVGLAKVGEQLYEVKLVRKVALFPLKAGKLPVGAMSMRLFRSAGQRTSPDSVRESEDLEVDVTEPPRAGAIAGTALGDVGDFTLRAEVAPREVLRGGALAVTLTLEGHGNFPNKLPLPTVKGVEWLEPEVHDKLGPGTDDRFGGYRSFRYVVRVKEPGAFSLGTVQFPYYSARLGKYASARADLGFVTVTPDGKVEPKDVASEILPNLPPPRGALEGTTSAGPPISDRREAWLLVFLGPLGFVVTTLAGRAKARFAEAREARAASPETELTKRIEAAKRALREGKTNDAVRGALTVLEQGALAKLGVGLRGATAAEKRERLLEAGLDDAEVDAWIEAFGRAEAQRYAPEPPTEAEANDQLERCVALVKKARRAKPVTTREAS